ncbi:MAG: hypothetical protein ACRCUE_04415 [Bosea sp. (in: a-proteobacteria)]
MDNRKEALRRMRITRTNRDLQDAAFMVSEALSAPALICAEQGYLT